MEPGSIVYDFEQKNEAFQTSGQVQYVALCGNFEREGYDYTGALRILRVMLSYDYLWINIRVKGGAYGCGGAFGRGGNACISSYRARMSEEPLKYTAVSAITCAISKQTNAR